MTIARVYATGRGHIHARLVIEGLAVEFVSARRMEHALLYGTERIAGLRMDGLTISSRVDLRRARLEAASIDVQVLDLERVPGSRHGRLTRALWTRDTSRVFLTASLDVIDTSISVTSIPAPAPAVVHVGTECIRYASTIASPPTLTGLTRGIRSTTPQTHFVADGEGLADAQVTLHPRFVEGRRAYLYIYGDGDDPQGNGTLAWRGVCATDLSWDRGVWSCTIDSITRVLDQPLGVADEPIRPRGINYSTAHPFALGIVNLDAPLERIEVRHVGFFESHAASVATLQSLLASAASGLSIGTSTLELVAVDDTLQIVYTGGSPRPRLYVTVRRRSGAASAELVPASSGDRVTAELIAGATVGAVATSTLRARDAGVSGWGSLSTRSRRVYVAGGYVPALGSLVSIGDERGIVSARDATASQRWVEVDGLHSWLDESTEMSVTQRLGFASGPRTLAEVIDALTLDSPSQANSGSAPLVTGFDISITERARSRLSSESLVADREWWAAGGPSLRDVLEPELVLAGCCMRSSTTGQLVIDVIDPPLETDYSTVTVSDSDCAAGASIERSPWGVAGLVKVWWGYDPHEDEHASYVALRDVQQASSLRAPITIEIEQRSTAIAGEPFPLSDYVTAAARLFGLHGGAYYVARVVVDARYGALRCGDSVRLITTQLPGGVDGTRPIDSPGVVVAQSFDLSSGRVELELLVSLELAAAYHLGADVDSASGTSTATLTITDPCARLEAHAYVGQEVVVYQRDAVSPTSYAGIVASRTATTLVLTMGTWPGSWAGSWAVRAAPAGDTSYVAQWSRYAYVAGADHYVSHSDSEVPGRGMS